jgi:membrane fusion protein, multidrug efflux system
MTTKIHPKKLRAQRALRLKVLSVVVLLVGLSYAVYWLVNTRHWLTTNDAYVTGNVITLKAQAGGIVTEVRAENTQTVHAGDVLVQLDGNQARIALDQAQAELGETVRRVASYYSQVLALQRRGATQEAGLQRIQHDLARYRQAARDDAVSAQQMQNAEDQVRELQATLRQTEAELRGAEALTANTTLADHPTVRKAANLLRRAHLEFSRQHIVAPIAGVIAKRRVQVGDQVQAGTPLLAIVPLDHLWVEANLRETEIARVRPGQPVEISVDAYPGADNGYRGTVQGLHPGTGSLFALLPPENASGNYIHVIERLPVRIALNAAELKNRPLRPGLSTITRIDISHPGNGDLKATTDTTAASYHTDVYAQELAPADALIEQVIRANAPALR